MTTILTERLKLRPFQPDDLTTYHARIYGDADVTRYLPTGKPRTVEAVIKLMTTFEAQWAKRGIGPWAVEERDTGEFAGHCGFYYEVEANRSELIYAFGTAYWGKGYATEAARAALWYGFEKAGMTQAVAVAVIENEASQNVMRKLGMRYVGNDVDYGFDVARYVINRDEFDPGREAFVVEA